jgi:hypothetical protein
MIVIICGGRDFRDQEKAFWVFDYWMPHLPITKVIQGGQVSLDPTERSVPWEKRKRWGADYFAGLWAKERRIPMVEERVTDEEWKKFGPAAGPMRNRRMLVRHKPEYVIALPGGRGTSDMLAQARAAGVKCIEAAQLDGLADAPA